MTSHSSNASDRIAGAIRAALACRYGPVAEHASDDTPIRHLLGPVDDVLEVAILIEATLGVRLPDYSVERMQSLGDLIRTVRVCLWASGAEPAPRQAA